MKGTENNHADAHEDGAQNDSLEQLFRYATARKRPPDQDEQAIRAALHEQWRELTVRRTRRRIMYALTAVASLVLAVFVGTQGLKKAGPPQQAIQLASVEIVKGSVFINSAGDGPVALAEKAMVVGSGQQVVTGLESRLALRWRDGTSVRLDQNSEVRFGPSGELRLVTGQVYVDSDVTKPTASPLIILTPAGPVRHLGTQYLARVDAGHTSLSVREGQVALDLKGIEIMMAPGEQLIVDSSGDRTRRLIESYGALWEWTQDLSPPFALDGRSLADFLDFVGRETGRTVAYRSPQAGQLARSTQLRGNVEMDPVNALDAILQTTDLVSETRDGAILVALRK